MKPLRTLRHYWWLVLPALALAAGLGWRTGTAALKREWAVATGGPPAIEYPAAIDLGDRTANEVVVSRFEVANRGGQELVINQVRALCSCGALERETGDGFEPVEELRLPPGGRAELVARLTVRTDGPGTFRQTVSFLTNDPAHPEGRITLVFRTASGGILAQPTAVQFGRVPVGREARQVVDVLDRDPSPQAVARVLGADPDRVAVRWVPATTPDRGDRGQLLGRVEVVPNTARPLLLDTTIRIEFADPKIEPLTIPVSGRVSPRVEVTSESLVLPLSAGGGPVYTGRCLVRGPDGSPPRLEVESASPGLKAELPDAPDGAGRVVLVTWVPAAEDGPGATTKTVRLCAHLGAGSETVEIPVTCERR